MKLSDLKKWFKKQNLKRDLQIGPGEYTKDLEVTVNSLIENLESNKQNKGYLPYWETLVAIKEKLNIEK